MNDDGDRKRENGGAEIRAAYEAEQLERATRSTRFAGVAAMVAILLFSVLDQIVYPQYRAILLTLRIAVAVTSLVVLGLTRLPLGRRYARELGVVLYNVTALSIVVMVHLTEGYRSPYYAGINIVLIVFIAILPLDLFRTLLTCTIVYLAYLVPILVAGEITEMAVFFNNNAFLIATIVLVILSAWAADRLRFGEFVARRHLAHANEELKKLDNAKSQFFANISHEVRTPLTSVIAPVQSLYHGDAGKLTSLQHDLVTQVYRNSLRLLDMINQMLDVAKFDARKMRLSLSVVDLTEIVREIATVFREVARQKGLILQYLADEEVPAVYLDREKIDRILSNLVRNAIKFTEKGSVIIRLRRSEESIILDVEDTGIGIPPDQAPLIFERFRQVDGSSTRRYEGTGLGLTIVKEAVELQHGTIFVVSRPDAGTRFTVTLPMDLDQRAADAFVDRRRQDRRQGQEGFFGPDRRKTGRRRRDIASTSFEDLAFVDSKRFESPVTQGESSDSRAIETGYRVVYVEDNEDLRTYVQKMLTTFGHTVSVAIDGRDGLKTLETVQPDVIVSDVMMPNMDGYEFLAALRSREQTRRIPVILTTAKSEMDEKIRGLERGADEYLAKPINIRELDARIRNIVTARMLNDAAIRARELEKRMEELTTGFANALELRDRYTANHSNDVLTFGSIIAEELGVPLDATLRDALLLHDVGKLGIPDRVLLKKGPLDDDEWVLMKEHAEMGARLLSRFESFQEIAHIIHAHQERYDGSGYPLGLAGEEIPLVARIIAVADAWHAMIEDRPYRRALGRDEAVQELLRGRGSHFDPTVVDAFLRGMKSRDLIPMS